MINRPTGQDLRIVLVQYYEKMNAVLHTNSLNRL